MVLVDASGIHIDPLLYVAQMALARLLQFSYDSPVLAFLIGRFLKNLTCELDFLTMVMGI
jgi:hypothetical protein